jgi:hypothetical protein
MKVDSNASHKKPEYKRTILARQRLSNAGIQGAPFDLIAALFVP